MQIEASLVQKWLLLSPVFSTSVAKMKGQRITFAPVVIQGMFCTALASATTTLQPLTERSQRSSTKQPHDENPFFVAHNKSSQSCFFVQGVKSCFSLQLQLRSAPSEEHLEEVAVKTDLKMLPMKKHNFYERFLYTVVGQKLYKYYWCQI